MKARHGCILAAGTLVVGALLAARPAIISRMPDLYQPNTTLSQSEIWPIPMSGGTSVNRSSGLAVKGHQQNSLLATHIAGALPHPVLHPIDTIPYEPFYNHVQCFTEKSDKPCSFPLLTDYFKRCGYFAETTRWEKATEGYPRASMSADICKIPSVTFGAGNLHDYIRQRNITHIVLVGDSNGARYHTALVKLFQRASFQCKKLKQESPGKHMSLDYYTRGSEFKTSTVVKRMCGSCLSTLHVCTNRQGHKVSVEYISMDMGSREPIHLTGSECKHNPHHPLCWNLTQQEYVFKYYLNKDKHYPQLLLIFSVNAHRIFRPLQVGFDAIRYKWKTVTDNVEASSKIIWYDAPLFHLNKNKNEPIPTEGKGLPANDKMQILNHFLSTVLTNHYIIGKKPSLYAFFDLYHMQERLKEEWKNDDIHSKSDWYDYVVGYTAAMLPSLPIE